MSDDITKLNIHKVSADAFDGLERVIEQYPEGEEPVVVSVREYREFVNALFRNRFGAFDSTNPMHVNLRRKMMAGVCDVDSGEAQEDLVLLSAELAGVLRGAGAI